MISFAIWQTQPENFNPSLIKEWTENFDMNGPQMKNLTKALVDNHVVVDPTLVVMEAFIWGNDSSIEKPWNLNLHHLVLLNS